MQSHTPYIDWLLRRNEAYSAQPFVPVGNTAGGPARASESTEGLRCRTELLRARGRAAPQSQGIHLSSSAVTRLDTQHKATQERSFRNYCPSLFP